MPHNTSSVAAAGAAFDLPLTRQKGMTSGKEHSLTSFPALASEGDVVLSQAGVDSKVAVAESTEQPLATDGIVGGAVKPASSTGDAGSRTPSPTDTGLSTPLLSIADCPPRLAPIVPPSNYGAVKKGVVFRSAYPQEKHMNFLKLLDVKSVLCLVETEPSDSYGQWVTKSHINRKCVSVAANKDGKVKATVDSICEAVLFVMDASNYPLYIHCNQGKHRTGCVVACLRKIQRWPIEAVLAEYETYAYPKARPGDVDFIRSFDPEAVFEYAKKTGCLNGHGALRRMDSGIANIDALAEALASIGSSDTSESWSSTAGDYDMSLVANTSQASSEDGLEMAVDPALTGTDIEVIHGVPTETENAPNHTGLAELQLSNTTCTLETRDEDTTVGSAQQVDATATVVELSEDVLTPPDEEPPATIDSVRFGR